MTKEDPVYARVASYRIQELAYGGLKPETRKRLEELAEKWDGDNSAKRRIRHDLKPIAGTRLIREWQGEEYVVTVTADGYEWQGRPYQSLSAIARAITGTRWNGPVFLASTITGSANDKTGTQKDALRGLYAQIQRGRARARVQLASRPTRSL